MKALSDTYIIHACPERMWYVNRFLVPSMRAQGIEPAIRCDTKHLGCLENCMRIFQDMHGDGGAWHLQDDVIICPDFSERTKQPLSDEIVCGFVVDSDKNLSKTGAVVPHDMWWSFPCIWIPNHLARECARWFYNAGSRRYPDRAASHKMDDWFFKKFMETYYPKYKVLNLKPNLVDHVDFLIGGTVINKERQKKSTRAAWFDDQSLVEKLEREIKGVDTGGSLEYVKVCFDAPKGWDLENCFVKVEKGKVIIDHPIDHMVYERCISELKEEACST